MKIFQKITDLAKRFARELNSASDASQVSLKISEPRKVF